MKNMGFDIEQEIMICRYHNNQMGIGVNELGDKFENECYRDFLLKNIDDFLYCYEHFIKIYFD